MVNQAQLLLMRMGMHPQIVLLAHKAKAPGSHTKSGPGRKHWQGKIDKSITEETTNVH